jgi:hypothetical protein
VFYHGLSTKWGYHGAEEISRIGHENIRRLVLGDPNYRKRGESSKQEPYTPHESTILDLEGFYWHWKDLARLREDPDAPLPQDLIAAMNAIFPEDPERAEAAIQQVVELLRGADAPLLPPDRFGEWLRLAQQRRISTEGVYPRRRKAREAKPPDAAPPEQAGGEKAGSEGS